MSYFEITEIHIDEAFIAKVSIGKWDSENIRFTWVPPIDIRYLHILLDSINESNRKDIEDIVSKCLWEETIDKISYVLDENDSLVELVKSEAFKWDFNTRKLVNAKSLDELKANKWETIKKLRDIEEYSGLTWNNYVFDSTPVSQQRIYTAALMSQLSYTEPLNWVLKDNSTITLNKDDILSLAQTLKLHTSSIFAKSQDIRNKIINSNSVDELDLIIW